MALRRDGSERHCVRRRPILGQTQVRAETCLQCGNLLGFAQSLSTKSLALRIRAFFAQFSAAVPVQAAVDFHDHAERPLQNQYAPLPEHERLPSRNMVRICRVWFALIGLVMFLFALVS